MVVSPICIFVQFFLVVVVGLVWFTIFKQQWKVMIGIVLGDMAVHAMYAEASEVMQAEVRDIVGFEPPDSWA